MEEEAYRERWRHKKVVRKVDLCSPGACSAVRDVRFFISRRLSVQDESQIVGVVVKVLQRNRARANGRDGDR